MCHEDDLLGVALGLVGLLDPGERGTAGLDEDGPEVDGLAGLVPGADEGGIPQVLRSTSTAPASTVGSSGRLGVQARQVGAGGVDVVEAPSCG